MHEPCHITDDDDDAIEPIMTAPPVSEKSAKKKNAISAFITQFNMSSQPEATVADQANLHSPKRRRIDDEE